MATQHGASARAAVRGRLATVACCAIAVSVGACASSRTPVGADVVAARPDIASQDVAPVSDSAPDAASDAAPDGTGDDAYPRATDSTGTFACWSAMCGGHATECADCVDNDGDGLIDAHDPDCIGPCHTHEDGSLADLVGDGSQCAGRCFFDVFTGDPACLWDRQCDPASTDPRCPYPPSTQTAQACVDAGGSPACAASPCGALTPNGCDCYGCCQLPGASGYVFLGTGGTAGTFTCMFATASDPASCAPCTPVTSCFNPCTGCEICIGNVPAPGCFSGTDGGCESAASDGGCGDTLPPRVVQSCPPSAQNPAPRPCGQPGQPTCPAGFYCITGCCQPVPL